MAGRFLSHPEMQKKSGSVCRWHGRAGLLGSPGQALSLRDPGGLWDAAPLPVQSRTLGGQP